MTSPLEIVTTSAIISSLSSNVIRNLNKLGSPTCQRLVNDKLVEKPTTTTYWFTHAKQIACFVTSRLDETCNIHLYQANISTCLKQLFIIVNRGVHSITLHALSMSFHIPIVLPNFSTHLSHLQLIPHRPQTWLLPCPRIGISTITLCLSIFT